MQATLSAKHVAKPHPLSKQPDAPCRRHLRDTVGKGGTRRRKRITVNFHDLPLAARRGQALRNRVFYTLGHNLRVEPHGVQQGQLTSFLEDMQAEHSRRLSKGLTTVVPWCEIDSMLGYTNRTKSRKDTTRERRRQRYVKPLVNWGACRRTWHGLEYVGDPIRVEKRPKADTRRGNVGAGYLPTDTVSAPRAVKADSKPKAKPPSGPQGRGANGQFLRKAPPTPPAQPAQQSAAKGEAPTTSEAFLTCRRGHQRRQGEVCRDCQKASNARAYAKRVPGRTERESLHTPGELGLPARYWNKVVQTPGCWLWTGCRLKGGYGQIMVAGKKLGAHRWAFETVNGPIPPGLEVDHICNRPSCVRPDHLRLLTPAENRARSVGNIGNVNRQKTSCPKGHEYSGSNLKRYRGQRLCLTCRRARLKQAQP